VAGVAGNGQRELAEVATGLRRITSGRIQVSDQDLTGRGPDAFLRARVFYVPEDRLGTGLAPGLTVWENLSLRAYRQPPLARRSLVDLRGARNRAVDLARRFEVRMPSVDVPVRYVTGGNLQKVILAREISAGPRVLVAADPTRGLDIAGTELVRSYLLEQREAGVGVLLISEDLDELLLLADRVLVLYRGQILGMTNAAAVDRQQIGLWMAGVRPDAEVSA
jgi:simple sugar transport system ATP-binding protein